MKIKNEYLDTTIQRGKFTLNCTTANPDHYQYYFDNGFSDIFEVEKIKLNIPELIEKTLPTKKTKKKDEKNS